MIEANPPYRRLGRKVFYRRFNLNLSLNDFEQATGIPKSHWVGLENGTRPFTADDLALLARLLDVAPSWFLDIPAEPHQAEEPQEVGRRHDWHSMGVVPGLMEIVLRNGSVVVIDPDFDADALNRLMGLLEKR